MGYLLKLSLVVANRGTLGTFENTPILGVR
jgi:hypothetical protein